MTVHDAAWRWRLEHNLALIAGVATFMLVYLYTGDADLLFAVGSGLAAGAFIFVTASFRTRRRSR
jgi:hypothetical protein